jgi:hypothetical protein
MKKRLSLLIFASFFTTTFAMETSQKIDFDGDGNPEVTIEPGVDGSILVDINDDGTTDFVIKKSKLKKLLTNKYIVTSCLVAAIVYGTDYTLKFFGIEIPVINYVGGDITTSTLEKLNQHGPEVWIFMKEAFPKLWKKFLEFRAEW